METARLKAFIEAAGRGSIKAAAESLGYTPSAISQLITALEKELNLTLFTRSQKGVTLTSEGEALAPLVRSYLSREDEIYRMAGELNGVTTGRLTIATYPSVATTWLPEIVRSFKSDHPGIQISIMESIRSDIFNHLEQNEADIAFLAYAEPMPYEWIPLAEENVVAAVPEGHRLASAASFPVKECEKVRMGLGISFVNELSAQYWNEHLVKLPLDPPQSITFGVALPDKEHVTAAAKRFLDYTVQFFKARG